MYKVKKLKNKVRIIYKKLDYYRSSNVGVFIGAGSLHEDRELNGISHVLEHMHFKGNEDLTGREIALEMDSIGADLNAYTSVDHTCLYFRSLNEDIFKGLTLIFKLLENYDFKEEDLEIEKKIIYDEINSAKDDSEDLAMDLLNSIIYDEDYKYSVLGDLDKIKSMTVEDLINYKKAHYRGENIVISVVGNFDEEELLNFIEEKLQIDTGYKDENILVNMREKIEGSKSYRRDSDQIIAYINLPKKVSIKDKKYPLLIINKLFGDSTSSLLFQNIREAKGLTYSIDSFIVSNNKEAILNIAFTCNDDNILEIEREILKEIRNFSKADLSYEEIETAKKQLITDYIFSLEDPHEEMLLMGEKLLLKSDVYDVNKLIESIKMVTKDEIMDLKNEIFSEKLYNSIYVGGITSDISTIIEERS